MQLKSGLTKSLTNSLDQDYGCIYESQKTRVYDCEHNGIVVVTKEYPKFLYYQHGINRGYQHIPKIFDLIEDHKNKIYVIRRERLFPIVNMKKLVRLEIIKSALIENICIKDKIVEEVMEFHTRITNFVLDFGPHCFMQTKNNKIVVSDLFMEKKCEKSIQSLG